MGKEDAGGRGEEAKDGEAEHGCCDSGDRALWLGPGVALVCCPRAEEGRLLATIGGMIAIFGGLHFQICMYAGGRDSSVVFLD
jgi:hypothetical protein